MKKLLLVLFVALVTQVQAQNYCDSIEISMNCPPNSFAEFSVNLVSLGFSGVTYDWILTDESGAVISSTTTATAIFSLPNAINSDTNYICLTSIFSTPAMTFACITCDTIVWDGTNWVLLSMMMPPCDLTGFSLNVDITAGTIITAITTGSWIFDFNNGFSINMSGAGSYTANYYAGWCITITNVTLGCDTTICENCIADTNAVCPCIQIYMPVCGCDGNQYVNYCYAECAGVGWTPAVPSGMPGGFLPCAPTCEVEIDGDSIICNWGDSILLEASPTASSTPFVSYVWSTGATGHILSTIANFPGVYSVIATDSSGCVSTASFTVAVEEIVIYSTPSPPVICIGDSIVMWINPVLPVNNIVWVPTGNTTPSIVDSPTISTTYIIEALDANGCDRRGEIFITVDSCVMTNFACMGGINPGVTTCVGPGNYALGQTYVMAVYPTMAACIADSCNVVPPPPPPCGVELTGDSIICSWGNPQTLIASPNSSTVLPVTYIWNTGQTGPVLTILTPGTYCVTLTDANGCTATECITVSVQDIPIYSAPSPPIICLGDSIVLEIDTIGLSNIIWVPNTLVTPPVHRVVDFPMFSTTYVVEAVDSSGCDRRGEIFVQVDSCNNGPCAIPFLYVEHDTITNMLEASQLSSNFSYLWTNGDTTHYTSYYANWCLYVVDLNGCDTTICDITTSLFENIESNIKIYPNPVKNTLTIDGDYTSVTIYDAFGKAVLTTGYQRIIDLVALRNGIYFLHINTNNTIVIKKITITK